MKNIIGLTLISLGIICVSVVVFSSLIEVVALYAICLLCWAFISSIAKLPTPFKPEKKLSVIAQAAVLSATAFPERWEYSFLGRSNYAKRTSLRCWHNYDFELDPANNMLNGYKIEEYEVEAIESILDAYNEKQKRIAKDKSKALLAAKRKIESDKLMNKTLKESADKLKGQIVNGELVIK